MGVGLQLYHQLTPEERAARSAGEARSYAIPRFALLGATVPGLTGGDGTVGFAGVGVDVGGFDGGGDEGGFCGVGDVDVDVVGAALDTIDAFTPLPQPEIDNQVASAKDVRQQKPLVRTIGPFKIILPRMPS